MAYNILKGDPFAIPGGTTPPDGYFLAWHGDGYWEARSGPSGSFSAGGDLTGSSSSQTVIALQGRSVFNTSPSNNFVLTWVTSSNRWEPLAAQGGLPSGSAGGDLSGTYPNPTVAKIQTRTVNNTAPSDGYVLTWITADSYWAPRAPTGGAPSGAAGGDLSSTYPNPTVAKINGASVPAAGSLTTGNILQVSGTSALTYSPLNLAGGVNYVTGLLPTGNQANQSLSGDLSGTTASATVIKINGTSVPATPSANQVVVATNGTTAIWSQIYDGYVAAAANISGSKITTATAGAFGVIQLAGDLGGTAASPTVTGIQTYDVNSTDPDDGYVLTWIDADSYWAPRPSAGGATPDATAGVKGKLRLTNDLGGTADAPLVTGLQSYDVNNTDPDDGYVLTWVDADSYWAPRPTVSATPDATNSVKGKIQLAGDLGGTAASPSVLKINGTSIPATPSANQIPVATNGTTAIWSQIYDGYIAASANISGSKIATATAGAFGVIQLTGDLGGVASSPTVTGLQTYDVNNADPDDGYVLTWIDADSYWAPRPAPAGSSFTAGGDLSGTSSNQTVIKINGASVPASGSLTTGNVLQVTGVSALSYAAVNLAGGANFVTGTLPVGNLPSLAGDVSGTITSNTVDKVKGTTITTAGGSLATGSVLRVTGVATADWGAVNLADTDAVTGTLPTGNQAAQTMGGDVSGTTASATVTKIQTRSVNSTAPDDGYVLTWDQDDGYWKPAPAAGGAPSGSAGGDLSGTYPNPTVSKIEGNNVAAQSLGSNNDGYLLTWVNADSYWAARSLTAPIVLNSSFANITTNVSTTSTSYVDLVDTNITIIGTYVLVCFTYSGQMTGGSFTTYFKLLVDGVTVPNGGTWQTVSNTWALSCSNIIKVTGLSPGTRNVKIQWKVDGGGTATANCSSNSDTNAVSLYVTEDSLSYTSVAGGDLSSTYPNPTVAKIKGNAVATQSLGASQDGYVLTWSNADAYWKANTAPSGFTAGGDLTGTSNNQTVVKIQNRSVNSSLPTDGYVLTWSNADSYWAPRSISTSLSTFAQPHDTTYSPIGLWQLDGNLNDSSGNSRHLSLDAGTSRFSDISTKLKGFAFDGSTRLKSTDSVFRITGDITVEMLIHIQTTGADRVIFSEMDTGETSATNYLHALYQINSGFIFQSFWEQGAGVNVTYNNTTASYPICEVFHLAYVRQSNVVTMYVNGRLFGAASGTLTAPDSVGGTQSFYVGGNLTDTSFVGIISSLKVINSALTSDQVLAEFNHTLAPVYGGSSLGAASGDLSGSYPSPTVIKIQNRSVNSATPTDGYVLTWSNADSYWLPKIHSSDFGSRNITTTGTLSAGPANTSSLSTALVNLSGKLIMPGISTSFALSNTGEGSIYFDNVINRFRVSQNGSAFTTFITDGYTAGGDLSGTYSNPVVAKIQTRSVNSTAPTDGYVLTWIDADSYWAPRPASGSATNIYAYQVKSSLYTLTNTDQLIFADLSGAGFTLNLPPTPSTGQWHKFKDYNGNATTNNLTISGNGKNIEQFSGSPAANLILNQNYDAIELVYNGTSWSIV